MPHIVFNKSNKELKVPSTMDGTNFNFVAKSYNFTDKPRKTEYKISTTRDNKEFLLTLRQKDDNLLLKPDKVTRVSPVQLIKDSLNSYAKITESEILLQIHKM